MFEFDDATFDGEFPFDDDDYEVDGCPCNDCDDCIEGGLKECETYKAWIWTSDD